MHTDAYPSDSPSQRPAGGRTPTHVMAAAALAAIVLGAACEKTTENVFLQSPGAGDAGKGDPPPPGIDTDGDGLTDLEEFEGWEIAVDVLGFGPDGGLIQSRIVTSDLDDPDTDGDGLGDRAEFLIRTDPRVVDTDGDGLGDFEEQTRWITNPVSVDTDGDARGPAHDQAPTNLLFDGNELSRCRTSPSLADTDGDGRTDFEELDDPFRSPLIAELPRAKIEVEDEVDMRLNVTYAEQLGQATEYGTTFQKSETVGESVAEGSSFSVTLGAHAELSVGAEVGAESTPPSGTAKTTASATVGISAEVGTELSFTSTVESSRSAAEEHSRLMSDSKIMTESSSSGSISLGLRVTNRGLSSFTLTDLATTVRRYDPVTGSFRTLTTLLPALGDLTLSPGERSPVLQVSSNEVNTDVVRDFLGNPSTLVLESSHFDLENREGIDFDFLNERTFQRTALLEIDFGDGEIETHRVATNVQRNGGGTLAGVSLGTVMNDILGLRRGDREGGYLLEEATRIAGEPAPPGIFKLVGIEGRLVQAGPPTTAFWTLVSEHDEHLDPLVSFDDIVLFAGQELRLVYSKDEDQDGLYAIEEQALGTADDPVASPEAADMDGDGLTDGEEASEGWHVAGDPGRLVTSDPRSEDTDLDGLLDFDERAAQTDPTDPDTDGDGLEDAVDPHPLTPAAVLFVRCTDCDPDFQPDPEVERGSSWANPFDDLQEALAEAERRNHPDDGDPLDDVSAIWLARGTYHPAGGGRRAESFNLQNNLSIFGGFEGGETRLGQRDPDPATNGTLLSGDLLENDDPANPMTLNDNSYNVVFAGSAVDSSAKLVGVTILAGNAGQFKDVRDRNVRTQNGGGIYVVGAPTIRDVLIFQNQASFKGAGVFVHDDSPGVSFESCTFSQNEQAFPAEQDPTSGLIGGAGLFVGGIAMLRDCSITGNRSAAPGLPGLADRASRGSGLLCFGGTLRMERCVFSQNFCLRGAGGAHFEDDSDGPRIDINLVDCEFIGNVDGSGGNGALFFGPRMDFSTHTAGGSLTALNCIVWNNEGFASVNCAGTTGRVRLLNCTVVNNGGGVKYGGTNLSVVNSIIYENPRFEVDEFGQLVPIFDEEGQVDGSGFASVRNSCIQGLMQFAGLGNIGDDPQLLSSAYGNLRLDDSSPCINAGQNVVDTDPSSPGFQPLPETDLDGNPRIVLDTVDMGAYEFQIH